MFLLESFVIGIATFGLALQPNDEPIKGKFISNLLAQVLPSALIFFFNSVACYVFDLLTGATGQFITMSSLTITFTGVLVLMRLCKPFNVYRAVLFLITLLGIITALLALPWTFFGYVTLELSNILFMTILVLISYPIYNTLITWFAKLRDYNILKKKEEQQKRNY